MALVVLPTMAVLLGRGVLTTRRNVAFLISPGITSVQLQETQRYSCLERLLRAQLPAGSEVVDNGAPGLDYQRIAEELTPGYRFLHKAHPRAFVVSLTNTGSCGGSGVLVTEVTP